MDNTPRVALFRRNQLARRACALAFASLLLSAISLIVSGHRLTGRPNPTRRRRELAAAIAVVVAVGLASRALPGLFPSAWGNYPGDALWALMVLLGIGFLFPRIAPIRVAGLALAVSCAVEFSQLYQGAWAQAVRSTRLGHLALGAGFDWIDLVAYLIGVGAGWILDRRLFFRAAASSS